MTLKAGREHFVDIKIYILKHFFKKRLIENDPKLVS